MLPLGRAWVNELDVASSSGWVRGKGYSKRLDVGLDEKGVLLECSTGEMVRSNTGKGVAWMLVVELLSELPESDMTRGGATTVVFVMIVGMGVVALDESDAASKHCCYVR